MTSTAVVEGPVVGDLLGDRWSRPLLLAAFVTPPIAQLTLDVAPLNALVLAAGMALSTVSSLVKFANGLVAIPFAVLLVVVTSAALPKSQPSARTTRDRP